jgi:hypothetical protein
MPLRGDDTESAMVKMIWAEIASDDEKITFGDVGVELTMLVAEREYTQITFLGDNERLGAKVSRGL